MLAPWDKSFAFSYSKCFFYGDIRRAELDWIEANQKENILLKLKDEIIQKNALKSQKTHPPSIWNIPLTKILSSACPLILNRLEFSGNKKSDPNESLFSVTE